MNLNASKERRLSSARVVLLAVVFVLVGSTSYSQAPGRGRKSGSLHQQSAGQLMALSADGTHLVNTFTNQPVFMIGEDAFAMDGNLSSADLETYFSDRASRGFNLIWISAVDNTYSVNPPKDYLGNLPFSGGDFLNMQEPYFAQLDYLIQRAAVYGITVMLNPAFSGYPCNGGGWCPEMEAASDATMTAYGAYLGNRYKNYSNIIWLIGGDADIAHLGSAIKTKLNDIAVGIRSADTVHLMTAENIRGESSLDQWSGSSWLGLNALYNLPADFPAAANSNYLRPDFLPLFEIEDYYEGEHSMTELGLRTEAYSAVLSGAYLGGLFGNAAIWPFGDSYDTMGQTWQSQLGSVGSVGRSLMGSLFRSREHWKMVPDISHAVVTAGYGSGQTLTVTSRTNDGQTIIAYIPNGNATTLTVDMTKITSQSQQASCSWFNPSSGAEMLIGVFVNGGTRNFTAPDSNDWVLVIDDASAVSVQVSPLSATLQQSGTQPFTATVTGTTNPAVTWSILPQAGTLAPNGQSALYTAPAVITSQQVVTITATSVADTTKAGSAAITLMPPGAAIPVITSPSTASGTVGSAFSYQITATNNPTSFGATGLPPGLSVNTATGLISGTPTTPGTSPVPLSAINGAGTGTATLTLSVTGVPVITSRATASGKAGTAFQYQITATNSPTSYGARGLPAGLAVNTASGLISGTPTTVAISTVTMSATNPAGTGTATLTLTIASTIPVSAVQTVANATSGVARSLSLSFPHKTATGNLILVAFNYDTNSTPSSVTDSQHNVFTAIGNQLTSPGQTRSRVYYAKNIHGGADAVTIRLSANSAYLELYLSEYTGADLTNPIDAQVGASGNAGAVSSGYATTTVAGDLIFGYCVGDWACTAGSGFAVRSNFNNNLVEDMLAGNPGSYAAKGSATNGWTMQMVALKP